MWLAGGASCESFTSLSKTFFSPVAVSTYQSSPCSPASSRCTKVTLVPSGLHLIVSGARPVTPASAKICSIVIELPRKIRERERGRRGGQGSTPDFQAGHQPVLQTITIRKRIKLTTSYQI